MINLFYHNQVYPNYKHYEKVIKSVSHQYISLNDHKNTLDLSFTTKNSKHLIIIDNSAPQKCTIKYNIFYEFSCCLVDCISNINTQKTTLNPYIDHTCITLPQRLTCYLMKFSAIFAHIDQHITNYQQKIGDNAKIL